MHPICKLILDITHIFFTRPVPNATRAITGSDVDYVTDSTLLYLFNGLNVVHLPPVLGPRDNCRFILYSGVMRFSAHLIAGCVHTNWFFGKHMLASLYSSLHHHRTKSWRCCKEHNIYIRIIEDLSVSIQARIKLRAIWRDLLRVGFTHHFHQLLATLNTQVRRSHESDPTINRE